MPFVCRSVLKPSWTHPGPAAAHVRRWASIHGWVSFGTVVTPNGLAWTWTRDRVRVRLVADEDRRTLFVETAAAKACTAIHQGLVREVGGYGLTELTALAQTEGRTCPERLWQLALVAPMTYDLDVACVMLRHLHVGRSMVRRVAIDACGQLAWPELAPALFAQMARRDGLTRAATEAWRACGGTLQADDVSDLALELVA